MSLMDAMLLEGYRDPREVYIALRTDGLKGSGTIDDPFDGSTRIGLPIDAEITCERREFLVTLLGHNLSVGNSVTIHGVEGPSKARFNITAQVKRVLSTAHFTLLASDAPSGPPTIPPAVQDFPLVIRAALPGVAISSSNPIVRLHWPIAIVTLPSGHGLGVLDAVSIGGTGLDPAYTGEYPILGPNVPSGNVFAYRLRFRPGSDTTTGTTPDHLDCTVTRISHRFDEVMRSVPLYSVIHVGPGTFETRGFASTHISHPSIFSQLFTGYILQEGQRLRGSGIGVTTLKLVLPHDEVTQTIAVGTPNFPNANYAGVSDLNIDCNASGHVAPFGVFPAPVTCGAVELRGRFMSIRRVRAINFCVQAMPECFAFTMSPSTDGPAKFNVLEDCIVEWPGKNNTHETTLLNCTGGHHASGLSPIVRHNYANCNYVQDNGSTISSAYVAVESITQQYDPQTETGDPELFELVTKKPHNREAITNNVHLNGVGATTPSLNGAFPVVTKISATELIFKVAGNSNTVTGIGVSTAYVGVDFHGPIPGNGTGSVVEGNALFDCAHPIYQDTGSTRDVVVRDNYFSNCLNPVLFNFNPASGGVSPAQSAKSLTLSVVGGKFIATFTIADHTPSAPSPPLQILVGDAVTINGARIGSPSQPAPDNTFNDTYLVLSVSSDKREFTYEMLADPGGDANPPTGQFPVLFNARNQVRRFVFENNICDLPPFDINLANGSGGVLPRGMQTVAFKEGPPFMFPATIVRDNIFQSIDNTPTVVDTTGNYLFALRISSFDNTLIEGNLIGYSTPHLIHHAHSGIVKGFNNRSLEGTTVPVFDDVGGGADGPWQKQDSLEDKINDSLLMSLL